MNGQRKDNNYVLEEGDEITLYLSDERIAALSAPKKAASRRKSKKTFTVIYEDDNILLANKPFGLLTHGDRNEKKNHLANQVKRLSHRERRIQSKNGKRYSLGTGQPTGPQHHGFGFVR